MYNRFILIKNHKHIGNNKFQHLHSFQQLENYKKLTSKYWNSTFANELLKFVVDDKMDSTMTTRRSFGFTSKCLHSVNAYLTSNISDYKLHLAKDKTKPSIMLSWKYISGTVSYIFMQHSTNAYHHLLQYNEIVMKTVCNSNLHIHCNILTDAAFASLQWITYTKQSMCMWLSSLLLFCYVISHYSDHKTKLQHTTVTWIMTLLLLRC